ncbi:hypothetical protein CCHL11_03665 [Colletotrichum chlorophyti]|uniref:Rhodopsin domain-containing protein n=1 Tax=Colletotrichum chlorophyti TaxID=708187 RepID=A0A1Q8RSF9_9PEZI|nr:hypothetical protein CCHL11_03665 [Colletotrichum chlorophyti]
MRQSILLGFAAAVLFGVSQGSLLDFAAQLPPCGIPLSACQVVTNDTCICSDANLKANVQSCLLQRCQPLEAIDVARIEAVACNRPVRNRKVDILAPMAIQIVGFLVVPLRLYARWTAMHRFEADDCIMIFCGLIFPVFVVLGQLAGVLAFGEDIWMVKPDELTFGLKIFYIDESFYLTCLALTKVSVLFFYLRIFPNKKFRWASYATMGYIIISTTILLFLQIFQCIPFEYNWLGWKGGFGPHQCLNINTLAFVAGGLSISHDVIILILPLPLLWHLNMSKRSKAGIFFMFSLGVFVLITSCVRLQYIVLFTRSLNPTWDFTDALIWSGVEVSVSMIVVCLPAMRLLVSRVLPSLFGSMRSIAITPPKKASNASSGLRFNGTSIDSNSPRYEAERRAEARAKIADKRRKFFSFRSTEVEPNESELELGDKMQGAVQTQIQYREDGPSNRRNSIESGIHVRTATTLHDHLNRGEGSSIGDVRGGEPYGAPRRI